MSLFRNAVSRFLGRDAADAAGDEGDLSDWNRIGRAENFAVCQAMAAVIDTGAETDLDFTEDSRSEELAEAVLAEVIALNIDGRWEEARQKFDPAYLPFSSRLDDIGLRAVAILGPERLLLRSNDGVLLIDGQDADYIDDVVTFALSRDRRWLALATDEGLTISTGLDAAPTSTLAWPDGVDCDPETIRTLDIANDGTSLVVASDTFGIWLAQAGTWTTLAPRPGVGDDDGDDEEDDAADTAADDDACIRVGTYAELKARYGGPLGLDACHAAISPDARHIAYGWQDAWEGHYLDVLADGLIRPLGRIAPESDYPYAVRFSDDSRFLLANSRHMASGLTRCVDLARFAAEGDASVAVTDDFLRANAMAELPGAAFGATDPVAWIGGAGWSHAAPISGGKPAFTQFIGSALFAMDYDPKSRRLAVASASGMVHVYDPFAEAEPGRERGYHPRRELYRLILWDDLDYVIRW